MQAKDLDHLKIIPMNKMIVMEAEQIEAGEGIVLPNSMDKNPSKDKNVSLRVILVAEDCTKVKVGDRVSRKATAIVGVNDAGTRKYVTMSEDDVAFVLRDK